MHSMDFRKEDCNFNSVSPETLFCVSLIDSKKPIEMDFSENPNLLLELEELRGVIGLRSALQAGILVNQDESCWITNLGRNRSTEVYRPESRIYRKLAYNQVAYLKHGDFVGFYGTFFRVEITSSTLFLVPVSERKSKTIHISQN